MTSLITGDGTYSLRVTSTSSQSARYSSKEDTNPPQLVLSLGGTSLTTDVSGPVISELRYTAWGEVRYASGQTLTRYQYTGQYSYLSDFGLHFYNARWYDSYLNQFTQPDTIVPDPYNSLDWNRYSYARYNPLTYTDPSGHVPCTDDGYCGLMSDTAYQKRIYSNAIKDVYKWKLKGNWTLKELKAIYQVGRDIETYVDGLTDGKGLAWMSKYLGGVSISYGGDDRSSSTWPWKHIYLGKTWLSGYAGGDSWTPKQLFAHELGHTWDMSSGNCLGIGGGVGDDLMWAVWGDPRKSLRVFRHEKTGDPAIPRGDARWSPRVNGGYGNGSVNDDAAEAFSWSIYNPNYLPFGSNGIVAMVVNQTIIQQANAIP